MSVFISLHKNHQIFTKGLEKVEISGETVGVCINNLIDRFPAMQKQLFDKKGELINTIEIYLNMESTYPNELATPVKDGDNIYITIMLAGG